MEGRRALRSNCIVRIPAATLLLVGLCSAALAQWSEPVNVSRITAGAGTFYSRLARDSFGTLHASWVHDMGNGYDWVEYSCKPESVDTWSVPVRVSRDSFPQCEAAIAIGPGREPCVVWSSDQGLGYLYIARRSGDTWTQPQKLEGWNGWGQAMRASGDSFNRIHVVWHDASGTNWNMYYALFDSTGWHGPETLASQPDSFQYGFPHAATDRRGNPHVSFQCDEPYDVAALYTHKTDTGWTTPEVIPKGLPGHWGRDVAIALDSADCPHVVWQGYCRHLYYSRRKGDTWSLPERLDSVEPAFNPTLCIDHWGRVSVIYSDYGLGFLERVCYQGVWGPPVPINSVSACGDIVAAPDKLHLLFQKDEPEWRDMWYTERELAPPGIGSEPGQKALAEIQLRQSPVLPGSLIEFQVRQPSRVGIDIFDSSGRCVSRLNLGLLGPGTHAMRPFRFLPGAGIYVCRVRVGAETESLKLVRVHE